MASDKEKLDTADGVKTTGGESVSKEEIEKVLERLRPVEDIGGDEQEDIQETEEKVKETEEGSDKEAEEEKTDKTEEASGSSDASEPETAEESEEPSESSDEDIPKRRRSDKQKGKSAKPVIITLAVLAAVAVGGYFAIGYGYFKDRYFPGTYINGYDVSGQKVEQAYEAMNKDITSYTLTIKKGEQEVDKLNASDIGLTSGNTLENIKGVCDAQHKYAWLRYYVKPKESHVTVHNNYEVDVPSYTEKVPSLNVMSLEPTVVRQNAKVVFSEDKYIIQPEVYGDEIDTQAVKDKIRADVFALVPVLDVTESGCYLQPEIKKDDATLVEGCKKANEYLNRTLNVRVINSSYEVGHATMNSWVDVDEKGNVVLNDEKISAYAQQVFSKYTTSMGFGSRKFKTTYGDTVTISGGDYGRVVDREGLIRNIKLAINTPDELYIDVPFSRSALGSLENDLGTTYAEIDLTNQRMWLYSNGQLVCSSNVVTGKPDGAHNTPQGIYRLKYKQAPAILRGPGYETKVSYWMPFNQDIGMHDATWQSAFGGNRYARGYGSHGCVNLPLSKARTIYRYAVVNMPVICYYHGYAANPTALIG